MLDERTTETVSMVMIVCLIVYDFGYSLVILSILSWAAGLYWGLGLGRAGLAGRFVLGYRMWVDLLNPETVVGL